MCWGEGFRKDVLSLSNSTHSAHPTLNYLQYPWDDSFLQPTYIQFSYLLSLSLGVGVNKVLR